MKKYNKGFTLIELLVVIAIIGILASVVLASLNSARTKGNDASIKSNLANTRSQAAMYYETNNGNYSVPGQAVSLPKGLNTNCSAVNTVFDPAAKNSINPMIKEAQETYGGSSSTAALCSIGAATTTAGSQTWVAYVPLKDTTNGTGFCVDSTGVSKQTSLVSPGVLGGLCP